MMTDAQGDRQVAAASTAAVPARMAPSRSAWLPIMKPGSSTKLTMGRLKVSQNSMKRRALRAPSAVMAPA